MYVLCLVAQSLSDSVTPMHCSPPGSSVYGILQARILEWVAIRFSRGFPSPGIQHRSPALQADSLLYEPPGKLRNTGVGQFRSVQLSRSVMSDSATPWTIALQAPLSMEFSRQEYWSGVPFPSLPYPGIKSKYPGLQADALPSEPLGKHHPGPQ